MFRWKKCKSEMGLKAKLVMYSSHGHCYINTKTLHRLNQEWNQERSWSRAGVCWGRGGWAGNNGHQQRKRKNRWRWGAHTAVGITEVCVHGWLCVHTCVSVLCVMPCPFDTALSPSQLCCQVGDFLVYITLFTCSRADFNLSIWIDCF